MTNKYARVARGRFRCHKCGASLTQPACLGKCDGWPEDRPSVSAPIAGKGDGQLNLPGIRVVSTRAMRDLFRGF